MLWRLICAPLLPRGLGASLWNAYGPRNNLKPLALNWEGGCRDKHRNSLSNKTDVTKCKYFIREFLPSHPETIFGSVSNNFNWLGYLVTPSQANQSKPRASSVLWVIMSLFSLTFQSARMERLECESCSCSCETFKCPLVSQALMISPHRNSVPRVIFIPFQTIMVCESSKCAW